MLTHKDKKKSILSFEINNRSRINDENYDYDYYSSSYYSDSEDDALIPSFNEIPVENVESSDFENCLNAIIENGVFPVFCETSLNYLLTLVQGEVPEASKFAVTVLKYMIIYNIIETKDILDEIMKNPATVKLIKFTRKITCTENDCNAIISSQFLSLLMSNIVPGSQITVESLKLAARMARTMKQPFYSINPFLNAIIDSVFFEQKISYAALDLLKDLACNSDEFAIAIFNHPRFPEILNLFHQENPDEQQRKKSLYLLFYIIRFSHLSYKANKEKFDELQIIELLQNTVAIEENDCFLLVLRIINSLCSNDLLIRKVIVETGFADALMEVFNGSFSFQFKRQIMLIFSLIGCIFNKEIVDHMIEIGFVEVLKFGLNNFNKRDVNKIIEALHNIIDLGTENSDEEMVDLLFNDSELMDQIDDLNMQFASKHEYRGRGESDFVLRIKDFLFKFNLYERGEPL